MKRIPIKSPRAAFAPVTLPLCFFACLYKLFPLPFALFTASVSAKLVASASDGDFYAVLSRGALLLGVIAFSKAAETCLGIMWERLAKKAGHKSRLMLYRRFLCSPLSSLYASSHGENSERAHEDLQKVLAVDMELIPAVLTGLFTALVYFIYLAQQSLSIALILTLLAFLQFIPPFVVKKRLQIHYDDCRRIEAELDNLTMQSYHGLAEIKLYGLRFWYLNVMEDIHTRYLVIGNRSSATGYAQGIMADTVSAILKYGTYALCGLFVLLEQVSTDTAVEAIALSAPFFAVFRALFEAIPAFAVARTAQNRLAPWFLVQRTSAPLQSSRLCASSLSLAFGERMIFDNASFTLDGGCISLLVGDNGRGKSTLLRLFSGLLKPQAGEVTVGGVSPDALRFPREVFLLPQEDAKLHLTPRELYAALGVAASETAVSFGLSEANLDAFIDTLSGGERKKVFLSLAFALSPRILLMDEPTNALDAHAVEILCSRLKERQGGAVIVTHDDRLRALADRVYSVEKGAVICEK